MFKAKVHPFILALLLIIPAGLSANNGAPVFAQDGALFYPDGRLFIARGLNVQEFEPVDQAEAFEAIWGKTPEAWLDELAAAGINLLRIHPPRQLAPEVNDESRARFERNLLWLADACAARGIVIALSAGENMAPVMRHSGMNPREAYEARLRYLVELLAEHPGVGLWELSPRALGIETRAEREAAVDELAGLIKTLDPLKRPVGAESHVTYFRSKDVPENQIDPFLCHNLDWTFYSSGNQSFQISLEPLRDQNPLAILGRNVMLERTSGNPRGHPSQIKELPSTEKEPNWWNFRFELYGALTTGGGALTDVRNPHDGKQTGVLYLAEHFEAWLEVMKEFSDFCREAIETDSWSGMRATLVSFQHSISFDPDNVLLMHWGHMDGNTLPRNAQVNLAGLTRGEWRAGTYDMRNGKLVLEKEVTLADNPDEYTYASYQIENGPYLTVLTLSRAHAAAVVDPVWEESRVAKRLLEATGGARVRVVWTTSEEDEAGVSTGLVMGVDTKDGVFRELARAEPGASFALPQIRDDGAYVLISHTRDGLNEGSSVVEWESGTIRRFADTPYGFALSWWQDPETQRWYVFLGDNDRTPWTESQGATDKIYKAAFDNPDERELFWEESKVSIWWNLSRDGRFAGGALPFNKMGVADLENKTYRILGEGCNGGVSPDNRYLFFFLEGNHRNLAVSERDGSNRRSVPIDTMPLVKRRHPVWLSQWSTETRFFTVMGPETGGTSQIHFGRFDKDLTRVERWVQVSGGSRGSSRSHAWVDPKTPFKVGEDPEGAVADPIAEDEAPRTARPAATLPEWPADRDGLVFTWREENNQAVALNADGRPLNAFFFQRNRTARFDHERRMITAGGWFNGNNVHVWDQLGEDRAFSLALGLRRLASVQSTPGLVLGFTKDGERGLTLIDRDGQLVLHADGRTFALGALTSGWNTVGITYTRPTLRVVLNGRETTYDASDWRLPAGSDQIWIGAESGGKHPWRGAVDGLAVYRRAMAGPELKTVLDGLAAVREARESRQPRFLDVTATLQAVSSTPELETIRPYTRSLSVFEWKVDEVHAGAAKPGDVLPVLTWTLMDNDRLPVAEAEPGIKKRLWLIDYDDHQAIQSERFTDDLTEGFDTYYVDQTEER